MSDPSDLTETERDIIDHVVDAEARGDLPPGGAVHAAYSYIRDMRSLAEKRKTMLHWLSRPGR